MVPGFFELLIVAAIVVVIVLIAMAGPATRRHALRVVAVFAGILLAVPLILFFILVPMRTFRGHPAGPTHTHSSIVHEVAIVEHPRERIERLGDVVGGGSEWLPDVEDTHAADVYCSRESAARQLGRQVADALKQQRSNSESADSVHVWVRVGLDEPGDAESVYGAFAETLRRRFPDAMVSRSEGQENGDRNHDVHVTVTMSHSEQKAAAWDQSQQQVSGELLARLRSESLQRDFPARFIHKPWLAEYNAFVSAHPDRQLLLVRGPDERETVRVAAKALLPKVESRLKSEFHRIPAWWSDQAENHLATQITQRPLRIDRFSQTFSTQVGDVSFPAYSREAILIDYSSPKLDEAIDHMSVELQRAQGRRAASWASVAGLFVLICGVYLALNAATKGYYTWVLRGAAIVLLIATIVMLVS